MSNPTIDQIKKKCSCNSKDRFPTTVKVTRGLYEDFKIMGVRSGVTLQTLVDKCMYRYVMDEEFRKDVDNYSDPNIVEDMASYERTETDGPTLSTTGPFSVK